MGEGRSQGEVYWLCRIYTYIYIHAILKGLYHEMNNSFAGLKNQISTFCTYADSFEKLCCLVMEKIKDKVLACFYENTY